jgi:uncharacterized protein (DUF983 family)
MSGPAGFPEISPVSAALSCACPRCGQGRLYAGLLSPAKSCAACGLDYSFIDSGDGPAVFVILILGFVIGGLALAVETAWSPPWWVHGLVWGPVTIALVLQSLRVTKALMIALQYRTRAGQAERR